MASEADDFHPGLASEIVPVADSTSNELAIQVKETTKPASLTFYLITSTKGGYVHITKALKLELVCGESSSVLTAPEILPNTKDKEYLEIYMPNNTYVIDNFLNSNPDCPMEKPVMEDRHEGKAGHSSAKTFKVELIDRPKEEDGKAEALPTDPGAPVAVEKSKY